MPENQKTATKFEMSSSHAVMPRILIVLGMVAAVVTILYFTPMPDHTFKSCDRPCHALDWPMICRIQLNVEMYQAMSVVCKDCPSNSSQCNNEYCVDGRTRGMVNANRQVPGPAIKVCHNDIMVVDVINKMPGHNLAVHWRGQSQNEAPFMDGVPMITQCPILGYTKFQYRFRASSPGTHFYHAYSDSDRADGFFGSLIVRQPDKLEPHRNLYDEDLNDHVIILSEWSEDDTPKTILINGKPPSETKSAMTVFKVKKGGRYRFRLAYAGGKFGCAMELSIEKHQIKIIALDGKPVKAYAASSISLNKGERVDFVLKTDQEVREYELRVTSECGGYNVNGLAFLNYESSLQISQKRDIIRNVEPRNFDTVTCSSEIGKVCVSDVMAFDKMPEELRVVNRRIYLNFDYVHVEKKDHTYDGWKDRKYRVNNITFTYPSSPILTQPADVPLTQICNELKIPKKCENAETCECVHVEHIPLGSKVELILFNAAADDQEFVFHLHGYHFHVVASRHFEDPVTMDDIRNMDAQEELFKRNFNAPVLKDTIRIPKDNVLAVRFMADNPGFWILRDENSRGYTRGMDIVFQVGSYKEMVSSPSGFPSCGSFAGPDFFLI